MTNSNPTSRSVLARLRSLSPQRSLTRAEARQTAENQAALLLRLADADVEPIPLDLLSRLPRIRLSTALDLPTSGVSYWDGEAWCLVAKGDEHSNRQRFSLVHEFKHVIDHPVRDLLYASHRDRELAADRFAACVLMPRQLVTRAWCGGCQDVDELADRFAVSPAAMQRRLLDLGHLARPRSRRYVCARGLPTRPAFAMDRGIVQTGVPQ